MAATLFGQIPSSTVQEALHNFLKVRLSVIGVSFCFIRSSLSWPAAEEMVLLSMGRALTEAQI